MNIRKYELLDEPIRRELRNRGWSQEMFAIEVGVSKNCVERWLNGSRFPKPDNLDAICEMLSLSLDEIRIKRGGNPGGGSGAAAGGQVDESPKKSRAIRVVIERHGGGISDRAAYARNRVILAYWSRIFDMPLFMKQIECVEDDGYYDVLVECEY